MHEEGVSFIHISDTHIGNSKEFTLYGKSTWQSTSDLIDLINALNFPFSFVVHTGDLFNTPSPESMLLARELFSKLNKPLGIVAGNHDDCSSVETLQTLPVKPFGDSGKLSVFLVNSYVFLFLDTKGSPEIDPHGLFTETHEQELIQLLKEHTGKPISIFTHFPPCKLDTPWIDNEMLLINGDRLHNTLQHTSHPSAAVFFGHIHRQVVLNRDSILYTSAPSPFCQFGMLPSDNSVRFETDIPVSCNFVTVRRNSILVRNFTANSIN